MRNPHNEITTESQQKTIGAYRMEKSSFQIRSYVATVLKFTLVGLVVGLFTVWYQIYSTITINQYLNYKMYHLMATLMLREISNALFLRGAMFLIAGLLFPAVRFLLKKLFGAIPVLKKLPDVFGVGVSLLIVTVAALNPFPAILITSLGIISRKTVVAALWPVAFGYILIFLLIVPLMLAKKPFATLLRWFVRLLTVAGVLMLVAWTGIALWASLSQPDTEGRPNIVLISIDTLRPDHLGCYGYTRNTSPSINKFAKESIRFTNCITPRTITSPAVTSMLTGLYPQTHGVRRLCIPLNPKFATVAEYLKNAGYRTCGITCNRVLRSQLAKLDAGFDMWDEYCPHRGTKFGFPTYQKYAEDGNKVAYKWLEKNYDKPEPFFLWIHYFEPHGPYNPPHVFQEYSHEPLFIPADEIPEYQRLEEITTDTVDVNKYIVEYDKEIRYTDHYTGELIDKLKELGVYENSLVIVTADHGESLTEHEFYINHGGYTYEACAKVPLLIKLPDYVPNKSEKDDTVIDGQVSLIDLVPTMLDMAGVYQRSYLDGTSIIPVIEGMAGQTHEYIFIEKLNLMKAVRTNDWKYIMVRADGPIKAGQELYHLSQDPAETKNLFDPRNPDYNQIVQNLRIELKNWQRDFRKLQKLSEVKFDEASRAELRSLGYLK